MMTEEPKNEGFEIEEPAAVDEKWFVHGSAIKHVMTPNKYQREIKPDVFVDVYSVLEAFKVYNPAIAHAIKKLLAPGERGTKDCKTDLKEAMQSIQRAIEMIEEKENT